MPAILFGSIGTLADASELQRDAFNRAFAEHGLDWEWSQDEYASLLEGSGGADRIAEYAEKRGEDVDAEAVHATKSQLFQESLAQSDIKPRPGVAETVRGAKDAGMKVAFVTTTSPDNVSAVLEAIAPDVDADSFDLTLDTTAVGERKPDDAVYKLAIERLGESAESVVAVEDNVGGVEAATSAGIATVAFPNENTLGHGFDGADHQVDSLSLDDLRGLIRAN